MALGRRKIEFYLEAKNKTARAFNQVKNGLGDLAKKTAAFARSAGIGLGLFTGAAGAGSIAAIRQHAEEIDKLGKRAEALGIQTEELSKLGYAAELTGSSLTGVADALEKMLNRVSKAAEGTGEAKDAIQEIGLDAADLEKLAPEEQFNLLADAISSVATQADKVRLKRAIFGRGDANILNLINQTSAGIHAMTSELEAMNGVITSADAAAAAQLSDSLLRMSVNVDALGRSVGGPVNGYLNTLFEIFGQDAGIDAINTDIAQLRYEIERTQRLLEGDTSGWLEGFAGMFTPDSVLQDRIQKYRARLEELLNVQEEYAAKGAAVEKRQVSLKAAAAHNKEMDGIRKAEEAALKSALKAKEQEFRRHTAALEAHRDQQAGIYEEIRRTIEEIRNFGKEQPDATPYDYLSKAADAQNLIDAGDFAGAMAAIREAMSLFQQYQEAGKASAADIALMTARFEQLAAAARVAQNVNLKGVADRSGAAAQKLRDEIEGKPIQAMVEPSDNAGKVVRDQVQQQLVQEQPVVVQVGIQLAGQVWGLEGNTGGTSPPGPGQDVQTESLKRGFRI